MAMIPGTGRFTAVVGVLALGFALAVVKVTGPYGSPPYHAPTSPIGIETLAPRSGPTGAVMQVVAHQDDDLYFMNPDVDRAVRAGTDSVTVFLTAGEADGRNGPGGRPDPSAYAAARNNGSRAAYAFMALGDRAARWERHSVRLRDGAHAELDHLVDAPNIKLVFLNTRKEEGIGAHGRLRTLWNGTERELDTLAARDEPAGGPYAYTRDGLIDSLADLMRAQTPTVVRTLDPDPDRQRHDRAHPAHADNGGVSDHQDHTAAARFTWEALRRYNDTRPAANAAAIAYRGYYNERWPHNLAPEARERKDGITRVYGWTDRVRYCPGRVDCGDLKVRDTAARSNWPQSTTYRFPDAGPRPVLGADGRLTAWAVLGGRITRWTQDGVGAATWSPARSMPGPGDGELAPGPAAVRTADGRIAVFALRIGGARRADRDRFEIVTATEATPGGTLGPWRALGSPDDGERGPGAPVVQADGTGGLHVFVRNRDKGISTRFRPAGSEAWSPWRDLGGGEIVEGLSAVTRPDGGVSVFGTAREGIRHWDVVGDRSGPPGTIAAERPVGPPAASVGADGRIGVAYRRAGAAEIASVLEVGPGTWSPGASRGAGAGYEALYPLPRPDGTTDLGTRDDRGRPVLVGPAGAALVLDEPAVAVGPTLASDGAGAPVALWLGPDGTLRTARPS
ncbi:PIG-L family deacetylase [Embleya sp. NPDC020886]|uniref:PIG-L family deacetylase n=1 Tax=Embleya sp. NPDC020886 TaxID=3363980 RepID=UPI0037A99156